MFLTVGITSQPRPPSLQPQTIAADVRWRTSLFMHYNRLLGSLANDHLLWAKASVHQPLDNRRTTSLHTASAALGRPNAFAALAISTSFFEPSSCSTR